MNKMQVHRFSTAFSLFLLVLALSSPLLVQSKFTWIDEEFYRYSERCVFNDNVTHQLTTASSRLACAEMCSDHENCNHFNWLDQKLPRCEMKHINASHNPLYSNQYESMATMDATGVCGYLITNWKTENPTAFGQTQWAYNCKFHPPQEIKRVPSTKQQCGGICESNPRCDHFTWKKINQRGTCILQNGGASRGDEVYQPKSVCGIVKRPTKDDQCSCDCDE